MRWFADQPYLLLSLTALFWAGNIVLGRFVSGHIPPVTLAFVRWGGACLVMLPFAWPHLRKDWPILRDNWKTMLLLSLSGISLYHVISYYALTKTEAVNALLIQSAGPLFVAMWALVLYRTRLTWRQGAGIALSLTGVLTIMLRGDIVTLATVNLNAGDLLFALGMVVFGLYSTLKRPVIQPLLLLCFVAGCGALIIFPFAIVEGIYAAPPSMDAATWLSFAYVITLPSVVAYLFFNRGIELIGPNRAAPFFHLQPVFGSILAIFFLGETIQLFHLIGFALVLTGVFIAARP